MDKYLRGWRQEAVNRGQNDAAIYIGDKVLALTNDDADAFWLAQVHFSNYNFARALALLSRSNLITQSASCQYLAAHCYIKQGKYEQALSTLGEKNPDHLLPSGHNSRRRLHGLNRIGSKSQVTLRSGGSGSSRQGTPTTRRKDRIEHSEERERDRGREKDIKSEAAMCHLRGLCYSRKNAFDRAKECFIKAVKIDVQCFEAFDQLMKNSLLKPDEELRFLEELDFDSIAATMQDASLAQEAAQFTKLLYTTRLSKYASPAALADATETLSTHYNLANNPDLLLSRAETLYTQCRFQEALTITSSILTNSQPASHPSSASHLLHSSEDDRPTPLGHPQMLYPLHLACLYETSSHTALFLLSHTLSQHAPHEPYTYLAIGTYYMSTQRIPEARRFFSKASLMDPHSAAAWIGFAHTFAAEGEHDQAIAAYSTAVRLFQGSHLPQLFIGMQHLALNNLSTAWEHCRLAWQMSSGALKPDAQLFSSQDEKYQSWSDVEVEQRLDPGNDAGSTAVGGGDTSIPSNGNGEDPSSSSGESGESGGDPLVLNELAVILYHQNKLPAAVQLFRQSLNLVAQLGWSPAAWVATRSNLAHGLRRLRRWRESLDELDECLRIYTGGGGGGGGGSSIGFGSGSVISTDINTSIATASAPHQQQYQHHQDPSLLGSLHTTRGLVLLSLERPHDAVLALHEAVRVLGGDASGGGLAGQLLSRAVEVWGVEMSITDHDNHDDGDDVGRRDRGKLGLEMGKKGKEKGKGRDRGSGADEYEIITRGLDGQAGLLLDRVLSEGPGRGLGF